MTQSTPVGRLAGEVLRVSGVRSGNVLNTHCTDFSPAMIRVLESKGWCESLSDRFSRALLPDSTSEGFGC